MFLRSLPVLFQCNLQLGFIRIHFQKQLYHQRPEEDMVRTITTAVV